MRSFACVRSSTYVPTFCTPGLPAEESVQRSAIQAKVHRQDQAEDGGGKGGIDHLSHTLWSVLGVRKLKLQASYPDTCAVLVSRRRLHVLPARGSNKLPQLINFLEMKL